MGDTIVVQQGDTTILVESDENTDPVVHHTMFQLLHQRGQEEGFEVDVITPEESVAAATDGFVAGGGGGIGVEGTRQVIDALTQFGDLFDPSERGLEALLSPLEDYEELQRREAAAQAGSSAAAATARAREALARERDQVLRRLTRAEEDRRLEVQRQQDSRDIQLANDRSASQQEAIDRRINTIVRNQSESDEQFALALENFGITRTEFERGASLSSDVTRATAGALGATGSPVQDFQERIRQLGLTDDRERLDNQEEALNLEERIRQNQFLDQLEAQQQAQRDTTNEHNNRILDAINGRNQTETNLANERSIEDLDRAYRDALAGNPVNEQFVNQLGTDRLLAHIQANPVTGTGGVAGSGSTGTPDPVTVTEAVPTQPGTVNEVVDTVVNNVGGGSGSGGTFT